jgi:hypothetical protein
LKFKGTGTDKLFMLQSLVSKDKSHPETSVGDSRYGQLPARFDLEQNYPNPFNPATQINYSIPTKSYVSLKVHNLLGQEVATLFDGNRQAGRYSAVFDGRGLASGVYFYRLKADDLTETKRLILLK